MSGTPSPAKLAMKTSMLQDVEAGRSIELDALVAAVVEIGAKVGVATPYTGALFAWRGLPVGCVGCIECLQLVAESLICRGLNAQIGGKSITRQIASQTQNAIAPLTKRCCADVAVLTVFASARCTAVQRAPLVHGERWGLATARQATAQASMAAIASRSGSCSTLIASWPFAPCGPLATRR